VDLAILNFSGWALFNRAHRSLVVDNLPELVGVRTREEPGVFSIALSLAFWWP
jgi:hypothetical protein